MLETERLLIKPLNHAQLLLYRKANHSLEKILGVESSLFEISEELQEALDRTIIPNVVDPAKNYLFNTLWTLILKKENVMVGDLCFLGEPDPTGQIEIGYGTYKPYQKRGIMTEAVSAMINWAANQEGVRSIIASTAKSNEASFAVLIKNYFLRVGETDSMYMWRKKIAAPADVQEE